MKSEANTTEALTDTSKISIPSGKLIVHLALRPAIPEDFYLTISGKKKRLYGLMWYMKLAKEENKFVAQRFSRHPNSRQVLSECMRQGLAYVAADGIVLEGVKA